MAMRERFTRLTSRFSSSQEEESSCCSLFTGMKSPPAEAYKVPEVAVVTEQPNATVEPPTDTVTNNTSQPQEVEMNRQSSVTFKKKSEQKAPRKLPPFGAPQKTKEEMIPDPDIFTDLDEYAKNAPSDVSRTIDDLVTYLTSPYGSDLLKVRALFSWMAHNIEYDTSTYFFGVKQPQDPDSVFSSGKAEHEGYSQLFDHLCKMSGIPCRRVEGITKRNKVDPENTYTVNSQPNHSWNLVLVNEEWRPVDVSWGAGSVDRCGHFNWEFDDHWFLTDPEEFLIGHFPFKNRNLSESAKYQLVRRPVSLGNYSDTADLRSYAFKVGLRCLSHPRTVIEVKEEVSIRLAGSRKTLRSVSASLTPRESSGEEEEPRKDRSGVLVSVASDGECCIYVRPPSVGAFLLEVFGIAVEDESKEKQTHHMLLDYVIKCKKVHPQTKHTFPEKFGPWGLNMPVATECGLRRPLNSTFTFKAVEGKVEVPVCLDRPISLKVHLNHTLDMEEDLGHFAYIENTDAGATIHVRLPEPGYYMLRVFGTHPQEELMQRVADYLLFTDQGCPDTEPYPQKSAQLGLRQHAAAEYGLTRTSGFKVFCNATDGRVKIPLSVRPETHLKVNLFHAKDSDCNLNHFVYVSNVESTIVVDLRFPEPGYYMMTLFAAHPNQTTMPHVADFYIHVSQACSDLEKYPGDSLCVGLKLPDAVECGLAESQKSPFVYHVSDGRIRVPLYLARFTHLSAHLHHADSMADNLNHYLFIEYEDDQHVFIDVRLPSPGYYRLRVFASRSGQSSQPQVADFLLHTDQGCLDQQPYPKGSAILGLEHSKANTLGVTLAKKCPGLIRTNDGEVRVPLEIVPETAFSVQLHHAEAMKEDLKQYTFHEFAEDGDGVTLVTSLPDPGYYQLLIFAGKHEDQSLAQVAQFFILAEKGRHDCRPYPRPYSKAGLFRVRLLEPLTGQVPAGEPSVYRLHAPRIGQAMVIKTMMQKNDEGVWEAEVTPNEHQKEVVVYVAEDAKEKSLNAVYKFTVCP